LVAVAVTIVKDAAAIVTTGFLVATDATVAIIARAVTDAMGYCRFSFTVLAALAASV
jgi:hypothetical protein